MEALVAKCAIVTTFVRYNLRNDWGMIANLPSVAKSNLDITIGDFIDFGVAKNAIKN